MYDCNVAKRLSVQKAKYTSPVVQNVLIILSHLVSVYIVDEIVEDGSDPDETKDNLRLEQLSICLLYLLDFQELNC